LALLLAGETGACIAVLVAAGVFTVGSGDVNSHVSALMAKAAEDVSREFGSLTVGGVELSDVKRSELRKRLCLVTHEDYIFAGTAGENLRMARRGATDAELAAALSKAGILDFFESADGLDTEISEGGANLSVGQRQRLSLARALLSGADIYIFDEATSGVDRESEEAILAAVSELSEHKCVLMISHRLANLKGAGRIYVMEDGRAAESGTHGELVALGGVYAKLLSEQRSLEAYATGGEAGMDGREAAI
jgi:ABC-type multidrug transport system fused ATPase/permease subunit